MVHSSLPVCYFVRQKVNQKATSTSKRFFVEIHRRCTADHVENTPNGSSLKVSHHLFDTLSSPPVSGAVRNGSVAVVMDNHRSIEMCLEHFSEIDSSLLEHTDACWSIRSLPRWTSRRPIESFPRRKNAPRERRNHVGALEVKAAEKRASYGLIPFRRLKFPKQ